VAEGAALGPARLGVSQQVRAAGGVVWRREKGRVEVVLVYRRRYDDWSFPKGKNIPGESDEECALREVEEETGLVCALGEELTATAYLDRRGRSKLVRYWAMEPRGGLLGPQAEIDDTRWVSLDEAGGLLTYDRDRDVLGSFQVAA